MIPISCTVTHLRSGADDRDVPIVVIPPVDGKYKLLFGSPLNHFYGTQMQLDYIKLPLDQPRERTCLLWTENSFTHFLFHFLRDWRIVWPRDLDHRDKLPEKITLLHVNSIGDKLDKKTYGIKCHISNHLVAGPLKILTNKTNLGNSPVKHLVPLSIKLHYPNTPDFTREMSRALGEMNENGTVWLLKPAGVRCYQGIGIHVISDPKKLITTVRDVLTKNRQYDYVLNKYIKDPLLWHGKKFHLRGYIALTTHQMRATEHRDFFLMHAKELYTPSDWQNKDIHDSHWASTNTPIQIPSVGLPLDPNWDLDRLLTSARQLMSDIRDAIARSEIEIISYPEADHAYEIFGVDIMFDRHYKAYLIEFNMRPGRDEDEHVSTHYAVVAQAISEYKWEYEKCIAPFLAN